MVHSSRAELALPMVLVEHPMEDFNALAARLAAGAGDARACLILSRDGLVMGAYPETGEDLAKPAWVRFAALGEPERGFVQFGDEVWCYVRRGPYAAFVLTGSGVRPGLVIDQMEQALLTAEEARSKREGLKVPEAAAGAPSSKPRAPLHPEAKPADEPVVVHADAPPAKAKWGAKPEPSAAPAGPPASETASEPADGEEEGDSEVDRVLLAREFSQLLQEDEDVADG